MSRTLRRTLRVKLGQLASITNRLGLFATPLKRIVVLSPHLDDAALSCGGTIAAIAHDRAVQVINVFAGRPTSYDELSPFGAYFHQTMGNPSDAVEARRQEDVEACRIMGAASEFWGHLEATYRRDFDGAHAYPSIEALVRNRADIDRNYAFQLCASIGRRFPSPDEVEFWAPLAIGGHIDHQIVRDAGFLLGAMGYRVSFYEDLPYAAAFGVPAALTDSESWVPTLSIFDRGSLLRKAAAVHAYSTQAVALARVLQSARAGGAPGDESVLDALVGGLGAYAQSVAGGLGYAERFWRLDAAAG